MNGRGGKISTYLCGLGFWCPDLDSFSAIVHNGALSTLCPPLVGICARGSGIISVLIALFTRGYPKKLFALLSPKTTGS